jgi:hypothetical protein
MVLFEIKGSAGSFVFWGADRWSQRTEPGIGEIVWLPLHWKGEEPLLQWHPSWNINAAAGTSTANPQEKGTEARCGVPPDNCRPRIGSFRMFTVGTDP